MTLCVYFSFINLFQSPHLLYQYGADKLLWGIISKPTKDPSTDVVSDLENVFSQSNRTKGGLDLVAFNIQRARDHGIPSESSYDIQSPVPQTHPQLSNHELQATPRLGKLVTCPCLRHSHNSTCLRL